MGILAKRHGLLGIEFDRYVQKHPELLEKIPHNARVILLREGNEKFNK